MNRPEKITRSISSVTSLKVSYLDSAFTSEKLIYFNGKVLQVKKGPTYIPTLYYTQNSSLMTVVKFKCETKVKRSFYLVVVLVGMSPGS